MLILKFDMLLIFHNIIASIMWLYHWEIFKISVFTSFSLTWVVSGWDEITIQGDRQFKFEIYSQRVWRYYLAFVLNAWIEYSILGQIIKDFTLWIIRCKYCYLFFISVKKNSYSYQSSIVTVVYNRSYKFAVVEPTIDDSNYHDTRGIWVHQVVRRWWIISLVIDIWHYLRLMRSWVAWVLVCDVRLWWVPYFKLPQVFTKAVTIDSSDCTYLFKNDAIFQNLLLFAIHPNISNSRGLLTPIIG